MLSPVDNLDETVQKLGGKVTLTVDRTSENAFSIKSRTPRQPKPTNSRTSYPI